MRIIYLGNAASVHLRRWAGFFVDQGHEVHIITTTLNDGTVDPRIKVHELTAPRTGGGRIVSLAVALSIPVMAVRLRRLLRQLRGDVVHVHYLNEAAVWAVLAGARPLIATAWGSDIVVATHRSMLRRAAMRLVLQRVVLATCDAEHMRRRLVEHGTPPDRAVVVYFGTNVHRFHPKHRQASFANVSEIDHAPVVVSTRNLERVYDIATLVRAVPIVRRVVPTARFLIGGTGSLSDELRSLVAELQVADAVQFIGRQTQDQLCVLLASSDVYVSTALSDGGLAASTAEAMASGTPVVITDVEDNADWVKSGVTGTLVPAANPELLAEAIIHLLRQPTAARAIGAAGREVIVARNNFEVEMGKVEGMYRRAASHSGRRAAADEWKSP